jgi:predicted secreted protein
LPAALLLVAVSALHAQAPAPQSPQNVVQLSAASSQEVAQDWLTITLSTNKEGADAVTVQGLLKLALDAALGLARPAVQSGQMELRTGNFSVLPRYARDGHISTWQGSVELILEGRDFARISAVAGKVQSLTTANVVFSLSREQRLKTEVDVQSQAIERFKAKATEIARGFGFAGYGLREINVSAADQPVYAIRPRMLAMDAKQSSAAEAPLPVEAGKSVVSVTVSGSVQLR